MTIQVTESSFGHSITLANILYELRHQKQGNCRLRKRVRSDVRAA